MVLSNLAGVPSIVFGLLGMALFVRVLGMGPSLMAGALTLSIMVLPIVVVATEEALKTVPRAFRDAALSLGATRWQAVRHHVLPNALPGIMTGSVLSLARALGETAPILFIAALYANVAPSGILDGFMALPVTIFYWTQHHDPAFHDLAASTILVLLMIMLSMNAIAIVIRNRAEKRREW
jgi:phosphate transport system permease protein